MSVGRARFQVFSSCERRKEKRGERDYCTDRSYVPIQFLAPTILRPAALAKFQSQIKLILGSCSGAMSQVQKGIRLNLDIGPSQWFSRCTECRISPSSVPLDSVLLMVPSPPLWPLLSTPQRRLVLRWSSSPLSLVWPPPVSCYHGSAILYSRK